LRGERVDVVPFSDDPVELIQNALAPARVREVRLDEETGTATVIVSDFQLSLAIGKEGQNARLAARLTGWRIDIKSETQLAEEEAGGYGEQDWAEGEWVEDESGELVWKPAEGGEAMSAEEWTHQAEDPTEAPASGSGETDGAAPAEPAEPATGSAGTEPAGEPASEIVVEEVVVTTEVSEEAEA
jgi:N utilization substance protein A